MGDADSQGKEEIWRLNPQHKIALVYLRFTRGQHRSAISPVTERLRSVVWAYIHYRMKIYRFFLGAYELRSIGFGVLERADVPLVGQRWSLTLPDLQEYRTYIIVIIIINIITVVVIVDINVDKRSLVFYRKYVLRYIFHICHFFSIFWTFLTTSSTSAVCHSAEVAFGRRRFAAAGPSTWNSLPDSLRDPELSLNTFKRQLNTYSAKYWRRN